MIRDYRDLQVWQVGMNLVEGVYAATASFPASERFGLASQMQRAAISVPSNIAEGHARHTTKEFLRFVSIAMGSLAELETQLLLSVRLDFVHPEVSDELIGQTAELGRMLRGLQTSLRSNLSQAPHRLP